MNDYTLAYRLKRPLAEIRGLPMYDYMSWIAYFGLMAERDEHAANKARRKR